MGQGSPSHGDNEQLRTYFGTGTEKFATSGAMGGIAAIFELGDKPADAVTIRQMLDTMDYHGSDGVTVHTGKHVALGACVMHTTSEAREATLPWCNEDGSLVLVLDGFVADYDGLRRKLTDRGVRLRNRSDAELVLRAFETWGDDCARHVEGEFAYVILDARQQSLHCARDHAGLRPLFYFRSGERLILASNFAAIRAAIGKPLQPDERVLVQLAANQYHFGDETVWQGVKRVMPAHAMCFTRSDQQASRYWDMPEPYSVRHSCDAEYAEHYRHVLFESVRQASRSAHPLGIEVSGGLDSTAVLAVADQLAKKDQLGAPGFGAFAIEGPCGTAADETSFIQATEVHFGRKIHRQPLHVPTLEWLTAQANRDADIPYYPNSVMAAGMYRQMAQQGHRVALNGLGGDEWLNGKRTVFLQSLAAQDWAMLHRSFAAAKQAYGAMRAVRAFSRFGLLPLLAGPLGRSISRKRNRAQAARRAQVPWLSPAGQELLQRAAQRPMPPAAVSRGRLSTLPMTLAILEQASRLRSQCGVEGRHPLFSRSFIEFSAAAPEAIRLRGNQQKFVHRLALAEILPPAVLTRSTKAEFSTVFVSQLNGIETFLQLQSYGSQNRLINPDGLAHLFTAAKDNKIDLPWQWPLWGTVALLTTTEMHR